jgi:hypothetical protein
VQSDCPIWQSLAERRDASRSGDSFAVASANKTFSILLRESMIERTNKGG